jgi:hypothetical protein
MDVSIDVRVASAGLEVPAKVQGDHAVASTIGSGRINEEGHE